MTEIFPSYQLLLNLKVVFVRPLRQGEYVLWYLISRLILPEHMMVCFLDADIDMMPPA